MSSQYLHNVSPQTSQCPHPTIPTNHSPLTMSPPFKVPSNHQMSPQTHKISVSSAYGEFVSNFGEIFESEDLQRLAARRMDVEGVRCWAGKGWSPECSTPSADLLSLSCKRELRPVIDTKDYEWTCKLHEFVYYKKYIYIKKKIIALKMWFVFLHHVSWVENLPAKGSVRSTLEGWGNAWYRDI